MSNKSYVTMEQAVCPACGNTHDTGNLLLDKRMRERFDRHTVTHWGMCEEHQDMLDKGFIVLVAISNTVKTDTVTAENALRTGPIAGIKKEAFSNVFNIPLPDQGLAFVDPEVIDMLKKLMEEANAT